MTCRELTGFLSDYLAGELPDATRVLFEHHLDGCSACAAYLASFARALELGKLACEPADGPVPDDVPEDLVRAILRARGPAPSG